MGIDYTRSNEIMRAVKKDKDGLVSIEEGIIGASFRMLEIEDDSNIDELDDNEYTEIKKIRDSYLNMYVGYLLGDRTKYKTLKEFFKSYKPGDTINVENLSNEDKMAMVWDNRIEKFEISEIKLTEESVPVEIHNRIVIVHSATEWLFGLDSLKDYIPSRINKIKIISMREK